jgi:hypothetical protein
MAFWDYFNKAKKVVGNIYEGGQRVAKVLNTFGKVGYNIGRGIYDYVADNPFNMTNYYSFNDQPQRIINPPQAPRTRSESADVYTSPYRPPPRVLPLPPPSRQNNPPSPPINPSDFYTPPERITNSTSITDFLKNAKPRGMKDGGLINNRPKLKYVL